MATIKKKKNAQYATMDVDKFADAIRGSLQLLGTYKEELELTIHMCATTMKQYARIVEALKSDDLLIIERTDGGEARCKPNPLCDMQIKQAEVVRKYLRELKLTSLSSDEISTSTEASGLAGLISTLGSNKSSKKAQ